MSAQDNGGPAFPTARVTLNGVNTIDGVEAYGPGMTLRDYFAAKAMQGWISSSPTIGDSKLNAGIAHAKAISKAAYDWADAMLEVRNEE